MSPFWLEADDPGPDAPEDRRRAAAAIRQAIAAMEPHRPELSERLRELLREFEAEADAE